LHVLDRNPYLHTLRQSPGKEKRLTEELGRYRANLYTADDTFDNSALYYPGDLAIINGRTGQLFTIHTGQGDSEVVFANDEAVYYRVNDAVYRAAITSSGKLGTGIKIAEGIEVVQAHWLFFGPPISPEQLQKKRSMEPVCVTTHIPDEGTQTNRTTTTCKTPIPESEIYPRYRGK